LYKLNVVMNEIINEVDVHDIGRRFAQIRKKIGLSQSEVAAQLGMAQIKVSKLERGDNILSPHFLKMLLFYSQHVSTEVLLSRHFDIDDPQLWNKDYAMNSLAKAKLQILRDDLTKAMADLQENMKNRINDAADYL
jgi:transcriptional regulator with XRE-family HTH domain